MNKLLDYRTQYTSVQKCNADCSKVAKMHKTVPGQRNLDHWLISF